MATDDEAALRAAEHRVSALDSLSWRRGAGAAIWARTIRDELERHDAARQLFAVEQADRVAWERVYGSALVLVVAIDQVLAFEHRVRRLTGDAELARARERYDAVGAEAEALRDVASHLEQYAVGEGHRQTGKRTPAIMERYVTPLVFWDDGGGLYLSLADAQLNLRAAAAAAVELAEVVERVREKQLERAGRDAEKAFERRWKRRDGA